MASKRDIKTAVNKLIKGKKMMISALSSKEKEELKERIAVCYKTSSER